MSSLPNAIAAGRSPAAAVAWSSARNDEPSQAPVHEEQHLSGLRPPASGGRQRRPEGQRSRARPCSALPVKKTPQPCVEHQRSSSSQRAQRRQPPRKPTRRVASTSSGAHSLRRAARAVRLPRGTSAYTSWSASEPPTRSASGDSARTAATSSGSPRSISSADAFAHGHVP